MSERQADDTTWDLANEFITTMARRDGLTFTYDETMLLAADAIDAWEEDGCSFGDWLDRIGGTSNLYSYLECLKVHGRKTSHESNT
jgi:hypothetical protein